MNSHACIEIAGFCSISTALLILSGLSVVIIRAKRPFVNMDKITERKPPLLILIRLFAHGRTHIEWDIMKVSMGEKSSPTPSETPNPGANKLIEGLPVKLYRRVSLG